MKRQLLNRQTLKQDITAGLTLGIESIPDAMAAGVLAGVNPLYALYAVMISTPVAAIFASSAFMSVQTTSAMALLVASVPQVRSGENAPAYLFGLALLTGIIMLVLGLLKLGSLIRFVPNAVLVGFINAVAVLIVLGQLGDFTGYSASGPNKIAQTIDLLFNLNQIDPQSLAVGTVTIILILTLEKTQLKALGMVVALVVASLLVPLFQWESVTLVNEISDIPDALPRPVWPVLWVLPSMIIPAISLALVGLVQGSGISKNYVNPDGTYPNASGDFVGQGAANIIAGLFQGMPVGGSLSATALVVGSGAQSRFANIFAGITMAVVLLLLGGAVGALAMPALAGLLIIIGVRTLKPDQLEMVWKTGMVQQTILAITFTATLFIPLQYAVMFGVGLSVLLFVFQQSNQIAVKEWVWKPGQLPLEQAPPDILPANQTTLLVAYGSLFFAAAPLFEEKLPTITAETRNAIVILNLRGKPELGSTFLGVLDRYGKELQQHQSKLMLTGVSQEVLDQLAKTASLEQLGRENVFLASDIVGDSTFNALDIAQKWVAERVKAETNNAEVYDPSS